MTLMDPQASATPQDSVNAEVIKEGLAMVPKKLTGAWGKAASRETVQAFERLQVAAKEARLGMWEYGDLTED